MNTNFEKRIERDLRQYLQGMGQIDERLSECPDVEEKWGQIVKSYLPDGVREFNEYPTVSLGWMMYVGMAVAKFWDMEWNIYSNISDLYVYIRDKRGYDNMDEYIRETVLALSGDNYVATEELLVNVPHGFITCCVTMIYYRVRRRLSVPMCHVCINYILWVCLYSSIVWGII